MIKNLIPGLALLIFIQSTTFAQDQKHEIVAGYGMASHQTFKEITVNLVVTLATVGYVNTVYQNGSGTFYLGYRYHLTKGIHLGIDAAYQQINEEVNNQDEFLGKLKREYFTFSAITNFSYINKPAFQMYSTLSLGYIQGNGYYTSTEGEKDSESIGLFGFQVNALGFRFGQNIGGFIEIGYGYKGVLNFGFSVKL